MGKREYDQLPQIITMKKILTIIVSFALLFCICVNCFAATVDYSFTEVDEPENLNDYDFEPLSSYWITSDYPFNFWPGQLYYLSITIDSSMLAQEINSAVYVKDSNNDYFIIILPDQILFSDGRYYSTSYFDPSAGGEVRYFQVTAYNRSYLTTGFSLDSVTINIHFYDGQAGVIDAGNGVMNIVTAYVDEVVLHWPLVLFCIVLPVISVAVSIIISFRERRDKN